MFGWPRALLLALVALMVPIVPAHASAMSLSDKAKLQAAMQRHVLRRSVDGAFLHLDPRTGRIGRLHPVTAHTMIMRMGEHFVLCFDFRDSDGKTVDVDFYLARNGSKFVVFHTAIGNRALLHALVDAGKARRLK